jgi:drug/metabolite transporter (DMT)-like permease
LRQVNLALLAAAATGVQVGAAIVASRMVVAEVPPLTLAMLRYAIGLLCLLPFIFQPFRPVALDNSA